MPKFVGFDAAQMVILDRAYRKSRYLLEIAVNDIGLTRYRRCFDEFMGFGTLQDNKKAEEILNTTIKKMFMSVATLSYQVLFVPEMAEDVPASMLHPTGRTFEDVQDRLDEWNRTQNIHMPLSMEVGPIFFTLDEVRLMEQSQVQIFLHELSHHAAATIDDMSSGNCYGLSGVRRLKGLGPMRAVRNAENVSFFLTRYAFWF